MRVWVVCGGEYEQWFLHSGVFSSLEKARAFCAKYKPGEYEVCDDDGHLVDDPDDDS